jgi:RES domain-containing protein
MLGGRKLLRALNVAPLKPLAGPFHRFVRHKFIALALQAAVPLHVLTGEWARKSGGRFNFPNRYRTTYLALDAATARIEAERVPAPFVHLPITGTLQHVLHLDDPGIVGTLQLLPPELQAEWHFPNAYGVEVPTQRLGHTAYDAGRIEAIAYPSTVNPGGVCLAVFPERLRPGSFLEVQDPDGMILERISG